MLNSEMQDGHLILQRHTQLQKLDDDIRRLALTVKHHEENLKFLKSQINNVDSTILDLQVDLGKYHLSGEGEQDNKSIIVNTELQTFEKILLLENTAAGIIYQMKIHHGPQASKLPSTRDVVGIVATLGKVDDDNLSRLLAEFLGLETMLAIVCKTYDSVKALEKYDKGMIDKSAGLHGLGPSIGRSLDGRFRVLCLENLRPYVGDFLPEDPEKRLALLKPRLPNGECPPGFCGFAVNMINVDHSHISCLTASGHGLRETLFYNLFSRLQVYHTRDHMHSALPFITDGAISLDGGIMRNSGLFCLGERNDVEVKFPSSLGRSNPPAKVFETEDQIKLMSWKKEKLVEDTQREETSLNQVKELYYRKRQELVELYKLSNINSI